MADNKQYITQTQENGSVQISEDVISSIVSVAISEVEGIAGLNTKPGAELVEMLGKKNWGSGVHITISPENTLVIDCNVNVKYGCTVIDAATAAQDAITSAVESMTGLSVACVNMNVCGVAAAAQSQK